MTFSISIPVYWLDLARLGVGGANKLTVDKILENVFTKKREIVKKQKGKQTLVNLSLIAIRWQKQKRFTYPQYYQKSETIEN